MTVKEAVQVLDQRGSLWTHCMSCGHNWKSRSKLDLKCNYCDNAPEDIVLSGTLLVLEDDGSPVFGRRR